MAVGLPDGQMGNSEVGHTNMGAGRIVYQELTRITKSIKDGNFFDNEALKGAMENCKANGSALHLMGLMSDGGVHSHITHLYAIVEMAKKYGLSEVYVHCFLDGRDVPPASGADYVAQLRDKLAEIGVGKIATVMGRYYAMDRDNRWERVAKAYAAIVYGEGIQNPDPVAAIRASYEQIDEEGKNITDEFVIPVVCTEGAGMKANDSVIFFNFRPDRAREITRTLVDPDFKGFERRNGMFPLYYVCMTQYDATMPNVHVAFKPQSLKNTLGEYISSLGMTQLRIAETEKYAHVTFFFNGGVEKVYEGEDRVLVKSPAVATYDLQPEMSAYEVRDKLVDCVLSGKYDIIIVNFANCDMVGHTGIFNAAKAAVEAVDACVGDLVEAAVNKMGGQSADLVGKINEAFDSDRQVIIFPAGLCSRKIDGIVQDLPWKKTFITKSRMSHRDVVPVWFSGCNSKRFYRLDKLRNLLKLKLNIAMLTLPDELYKSQHKSYRLIFGKPIPWQTFTSEKRDAEWAAWVREKVYELPKTDNL